jgi:hypothetical protein
MKTAIILHGRPGKEDYYDPTSLSESNKHWLPWLQKQLIIRDILAQTPELPRPFGPIYDEWKGIVEQLHPSEETILVGHSYGAGFLVRWLSENKSRKASRIVLVAPSLGYGFKDRQNFFEFDIDPELANRTQGIVILVAKNDKEAIQKATRELVSSMHGVKLRELNHGGHFTYRDMGTEKFPELLEEVLS